MMATDKRPSSMSRWLDCSTTEELRKKPSWTFTPLAVTESFSEYIREQILPDLPLSGNKLEEKRQTVIVILANLKLLDNAGRVLRIPRDTSQQGVRLRNQVLDALEQLGCVLAKSGSEMSKSQTRYALSHHTRRQLRKEGFMYRDIAQYLPPSVRKIGLSDQDRSKCLVQIRDDDGNQIPFARFSKADREEILRLERRINEINSFNLDHAFRFHRVVNGKITYGQPNVCVRAMFVNDLQHGGRLYANTVNGYTHLPKAERRTMLIDGEGIAELDYSGFHLRMLYHLAGLGDLPKDVYAPIKVIPGLRSCGKKKIEIARSGIKRATVAALNAPDYHGALGAVWEYHREHPSFANLMDQLDASPSQLLSGVLEVHHQIEDSFFTGVGMKLQAEHDLPLMLDMLGQFAGIGKPALGLHDGLIVRGSDRKLAKRIMKDTYRKRFGFKPKVRRDY